MDATEAPRRRRSTTRARGGRGTGDSSPRSPCLRVRDDIATSARARASTRATVFVEPWRRAGRARARAPMTTRTRADGARDDDDRGGTLDFEAAMNKEFVRVEVPALLFPQQETLLPGTRLTLHLYEARFLALLDRVTANTGGLVAQLTFLPPTDGGVEGEGEGLRVNTSATLMRVERVRREEVGARVEVVGESRVKLEDIASREPFITGIFTHVPQMGDVGTYVPSEAEMAQVKEVTDYVENAVGDVLTLSDKLLSGTEEGEDEEDGDAFDGIWTHKEAGDLRSAMAWVDAPAVTLEDIEDGDVSMDAADWTRVEDGFAHSALSRAERLSFAVLQVAPASTSSDLQKLIACRAVAMSTDHGLLDRLRLGVSVLDDQLASLRAKVALKNLGSTL